MRNNAQRCIECESWLPLLTREAEIRSAGAIEKHSAKSRR